MRTKRKIRAQVLFYPGRNKVAVTSHPHLELLFLKQLPCKHRFARPYLSSQLFSELVEEAPGGRWGNASSMAAWMGCPWAGILLLLHTGCVIQVSWFNLTFLLLTIPPRVAWGINDLHGASSHTIRAKHVAGREQGLLRAPLRASLAISSEFPSCLLSLIWKFKRDFILASPAEVTQGQTEFLLTPGLTSKLRTASLQLK